METTEVEGGRFRTTSLLVPSRTSSDAIDSVAVAPVFIVASDGSGSVRDVPQPEEA
jgi:hypothetical protein